MYMCIAVLQFYRNKGIVINKNSCCIKDATTSSRGHEMTSPVKVTPMRCLITE